MDSLGGYRLVRLLGRGRRADVWLGHGGSTPNGTETVAIKSFHSHTDRESIDAEIEALARADHRHLLRLDDLAMGPNGLPCLILGKLSRVDLADVLAVRDLSPGEAVTVLAPLALAVAELHRVGIAHGALRPAAVLFDDGGAPVLARFGAATVVGPLPREVTDNELQPGGASGAERRLDSTAALTSLPPARASSEPAIRADLDSFAALCRTALGAQWAPRAVVEREVETRDPREWLLSLADRLFELAEPEPVRLEAGELAGELVGDSGARGISAATGGAGTGGAGEPAWPGLPPARSIQGANAMSVIGAEIRGQEATGAWSHSTVFGSTGHHGPEHPGAESLGAAWKDAFELTHLPPSLKASVVRPAIEFMEKLLELGPRRLLSDARRRRESAANHPARRAGESDVAATGGKLRVRRSVWIFAGVVATLLAGTVLLGAFSASSATRTTTVDQNSGAEAPGSEPRGDATRAGSPLPPSQGGAPLSRARGGASAPNLSAPSVSEAVLHDDDPVPAARALLAARGTCLARLSVLCLDGVHQPDSASLEADSLLMRWLQEHGHGATTESPPILSGRGNKEIAEATLWAEGEVSLVERLGDTAFLEVIAEDRGSASLLLVKTVEGWRIRNLTIPDATSPLEAP